MADFVANYMMYWRLRSVSCPGHFKQPEIDRRIRAWIEMSIWWEKIEEKH